MSPLEARIQELNSSKHSADRAMAELLETGIMDCLSVFKQSAVDKYKINEILGAVISVFIADLLQHAAGMRLDGKIRYAATLRGRMIDHFDNMFIEVLKFEAKR